MVSCEFLDEVEFLEGFEHGRKSEVIRNGVERGEGYNRNR